MDEPAGGSGERRLLSGWGGRPRSVARVVDATANTRALFAGPLPRGVIARGLGRSYGDAALNSGGVVSDMTAQHGILDADADVGTVRVLAGTSLHELMRTLVPAGRFPVVTPGTRYVTVGGAIACDIHGKNHHRDGGFGQHVRSFRLATPDGRERTVTPDGDPEVFRATCGGMGLTGVITEATLALLPIETSMITVDTDRCADLDEVMARMAQSDHAYRYSVAWIDLMARGRHTGRSVLTRGDHAPLAALPTQDRGQALDFQPRQLATVPAWTPSGLLRRCAVRGFNELWFRKAPRRERGHLQSLARFFHPLDGIDRWNRLYGPRGFVQYQFVVPDGEEIAVRRIVEQLSARGLPTFLAVLKRFGPQSGYLSFPRKGWTLALDVPIGPKGLDGLLDELDRQVAAAGGRVYLAKDARMRPEAFADMYDRVDSWREIQRRLDPRQRMRSDLARRLHLI